MREIRSTVLAAATLVAGVGAHAGGVLFVDVSAPPGGDGSSWAAAFPDLQGALDAAAGRGDVEIWIAGGEYAPVVETTPGAARSATFELAGHLTLRGGFEGDESAPGERDDQGPETVLTGDLGVPLDASDNAYHVVTLAGGSEVVLDRLSVGFGAADGQTVNALGGGVFVGGDASLTIIDGEVRDNLSSLSGAGVHAASGGAVTLIRCTVTDNDAGGSGGGVFVLGGTLQVVASTLDGNSAGVGGAIAAIESDTVVVSSRCSGNEAMFYGGALHSCTGSMRIINSLVVGNRQSGSSSYVGAGVHVCDGLLRVTNTTVAHNVGDPGGPRAGAGIDAAFNATVELQNAIIWDNTSGDGAPTSVAQVRLDGSSSAAASRSLIHGWDDAFPSAQTSGFDPRFIDPLGIDGVAGGDDDFRVYAASRAIDAADSGDLPADTFDLDGDLDLAELLPSDVAELARFVDDPEIADLGTGAVAFLDLGPHEFVPGVDASLWVGSGDPGEAANWFPAPPSGLDAAIDAQGGDLATDGAWMTARTVVSRGDTAFDLSGGELTLTDELVVGPWVREHATLTIRGGALRTPRAIIGGPPESDGAVVLDGADAELDVAGQFMIVRGAIVLDGGRALAGSPLDVGPDGAIRGRGLIDGDVLSAGELNPGSSGAPDVVTIEGLYDQRLNPQGRGALVIDIAGPARGVMNDRVEVIGNARLGGRLEVRFADGHYPEVGEEFVVLRAQSIFKRFDVAYLPGFPDDRILRVEYRESARGGQEVVVIVESVTDLLNLGAEDGLADLDGDPVAATLGFFNDDAFPDLALAIPSQTPGQAGTAVVVFNAGLDLQGEWLGFSGASVFNVGRSPSAIASAQLDGLNADDIVVANAGDGDVSVLRNTGFGSSFNRTDYLVGAEPDGLAIAELDANPGLDIVAINSGFSLPPMDQVTVLGNIGGGGFGFAGAIGGLREVDDVDPIDVDNDKDLDLIISGAGQQGSGEILIFVNQSTRGGFSFVNAAQFTLPSPARRVTAADLNADGRIDIVALLPSQGSIAVLAGEEEDLRGSLSFAPAAILDIGDDPLWLVLEDLDGDGDPDIGALARDENNVRAVQALRNDATPGGEVAFAQPESFESPSATALAAGDVDGDGIIDLVAVGDTALRGGLGDVEVLFNQPRIPGDANGDGVVDFTDLNAVLAQFGDVGTGLLGDVNDDGVVDFSDLNAVLVAFGTSR